MKLFYEEFKDYSLVMRARSNKIDHILMVKISFPDDVLYTSNSIRVLIARNVLVELKEIGTYHIMYQSLDEMTSDVKLLKELDVQKKIMWDKS